MEINDVNDIWMVPWTLHMVYFAFRTMAFDGFSIVIIQKHPMVMWIGFEIFEGSMILPVELVQYNQIPLFFFLGVPSGILHSIFFGVNLKVHRGVISFTLNSPSFSVHSPSGL